MSFDFAVFKMNYTTGLWQNHGMSIYPPKIDELCRSPRRAIKITCPSAIGRCAAFECGTVIEIHMQIEPNSRSIESISYQTNGCGFMVAAAEVLAARFQRTKLTELRGADEIEKSILEEFDNLSDNRSHCISTVLEAFRNALAEYRAKCVEEFRGEKALICTCFGVDEERIVSIITSQNVTDVADVMAACNAGRGCGSCRILMQELIDSTQHEKV